MWIVEDLIRKRLLDNPMKMRALQEHIEVLQKAKKNKKKKKKKKHRGKDCINSTLELILQISFLFYEKKMY